MVRGECRKVIWELNKEAKGHTKELGDSQWGTHTDFPSLGTVYGIHCTDGTWQGRVLQMLGMGTMNGWEFLSVLEARGKARTSQQLRVALYLKAFGIVVQGNFTVWNHMDQVYHVVAVVKFIPTNKLTQVVIEGNGRPCVKVEEWVFKSWKQSSLHCSPGFSLWNPPSSALPHSWCRTYIHSWCSFL